MGRIILASGSPRRRELLERIGVTNFQVLAPETEETYPVNLTPPEIVAYLSQKKAAAAAALCGPEDLLIAADTMVFLGDRRLGKPRDAAEALEMLTALQGRRHAPGNPWTRRAPMASRARGLCWWSGWRGISSM